MYLNLYLLKFRPLPFNLQIIIGWCIEPWGGGQIVVFIVARQETWHFEGAPSFLVLCFVQCNCSLAGVRNGGEKKVFAWEGTWKGLELPSNCK